MIKFSFGFGRDKAEKAMGRMVARSSLEFRCPTCTAVNAVSGADIAAERPLECHGCGRTIELRDMNGSFGRAIRGE